jgi:2-phospho-L-lactate guanylyltransferase
VRAVLVPVKSFAQAKHRLSPVLDDTGRAALARHLGSLVLAAAGDCPTHVACDDDEVADWALEQGAQVLFTPGLGLSGAVTAGVAQLGARGIELVVVAHADLPFAHDLDAFGQIGEVTLAPDRRLDGTNLAAVPAASGYTFSYGPASFSRHRAEAERLGLRCRIVHDWRLAFDVDTPAELAVLRERVVLPPLGMTPAPAAAVRDIG